jgi:hypothetical protein
VFTKTRLLRGLALCLLLAGCVSSYYHGMSPSELEEAFLSSFLVTSLDRFYPSGLPPTPSIYPKLPEESRKGIERDMQGVVDGVGKLATKRQQLLDKTFPGMLTPVGTLKYSALNEGSHQAKSTDTNIIVDIRVNQAIFRGALLDTMVEPPFTAFVPLFPHLDVKTSRPDVQKPEEREAVAILLKEVGAAKSAHLSKYGFGAFEYGGEAYAAAEHLVGLVENTKTLNTNYAAAVSFMVAHERGHIALRHSSKLDAIHKTLQGPPKEGDPFCTAMADFELQADEYAETVLSPYEAGYPTAFDELLHFDLYSGAGEFFKFGFSLIGFDSVGMAGCPYPSAEKRLAKVEQRETLAKKQADERFNAAINKAYQEMFDAAMSGASSPQK